MRKLKSGRGLSFLINGRILTSGSSCARVCNMKCPRKFAVSSTFNVVGVAAPSLKRSCFGNRVNAPGRALS